jgi:hypothetical protein
MLLLILPLLPRRVSELGFKIVLNENQLRDLLHSSETHWVERKKTFHPSSVKEAIVAFANSVPENQCAVLFIGVGPDGRLVHLEKADEKQRDIRKIAEDECFPPIQCTPAIVREGSMEIVAVVVKYSKDRPHFAGSPFVRVGSETIRDKQKLRTLLDDLIASRNDKARRILRDKEKIVTVIWRERESIESDHKRSQIANAGFLASYLLYGDRKLNCRVEECDAHCVHLFEIATGEHFSAPLENVKMDYDHAKNQTKLIIYSP